MSGLPPLALERLPEHAEALRPKVRAFLDERLKGLAPDRRARSWMGFDADFSRAMAREGWVGLTLPTEYGGAGMDPFSRFVIVEEMLARGAPVSAHWIADRQSGPLILKFGTDTQKRALLPRICQADAFFCIGMSEPQAGSDLASVRTRAARVDGGWRLSGQKIWTTNAHRSHYMIALVRTSGTPEDRQKGLSQFIVDLSLPGITVRSIEDLAGDSHFNEVFFDDVLLADDALIGAEGSGWAQVNAELAFERSGPERIYATMVLFDTWLDFVRKQPADPTWAALAGRIVCEMAVLRSMSISLTARLAKGESPLVEAALVKDLGTQLEQDMPIWIADALGADGEACADDDLMRTLAYSLQISPTYSLRGGTREILRGMIARGLGLR
ncbi:MAG: acyl-CoA dehydrogenase family protein [Burkholderiales bacterium]